MKIEEYFQIEYNEWITVSVGEKVSINDDFNLTIEDARKLAESILNNTK